MAAGLGFKTFTTGEVLTAADTNGYLMQGVLVFASAAARDAAITSPQEGQCCYLKDTDAVLTYSGAAWVGFDDSNAIQNAIVDAKGDLIAASAADTPARLAVGTDGQTLVADSTASTGLKWATPASGSTFAGCRVYMSAATTSIANSTWTTVSFDSEVYDTDGFHSTSVNTSRITIPSGKAGYYLIIATTDFAQNSTAARGNIIMVNGTEKAIVSATPNTSEGATFNNSVILALSVGDYVETQVRQTSGGALNLRGTAIDATNLIAAYLGA